MPTVRLIPSTYYLSSSSYLSVSSASNMYNNTDNTTYATVTNSRTSTTSYYIYLRGFNFNDIPSTAIINSFTVKLKARESGVSTSSSYKPYLANGTSTINGSCNAITTTATTLTFTGISADWETIKNYGSNFGIQINCRRASKNTTSYMYIYGAEIEVTYTLPVYHNISISGENVSPTGTQSVLEGSSLTVKAYYDTKPVVTDNGVDVTNQLVQMTDSRESYDIENITTSYGFELNSNNYYESNNQGHSNSAAVCRVDIHVPVSATVTFSVINYAESTYDFGLLSNIDKTLDTDSSADTTNVYWSGKEHNSSSVQTVTYSNVTAGDHFIYVKYFKDQYTDDNNDSLQFKVAITLNESFVPSTYWGYTLSNITTNHTIVVSLPASDIMYIKRNGSWVEISGTSIIYKKINGSWVEQSDLTNVFESGVNYKYSG